LSWGKIAQKRSSGREIESVKGEWAAFWEEKKGKGHTSIGERPQWKEKKGVCAEKQSAQKNLVTKGKKKNPRKGEKPWGKKLDSGGKMNPKKGSS